jgi:hypothetical protein
MQSILSVAGIVLAIAAPGESMTSGTAGGTVIGAADDGPVTAWNSTHSSRADFATACRGPCRRRASRGRGGPRDRAATIAGYP